MIKDHIKNRNALIDLGLTYNQLTDELLSLSVLDYCSGPKSDQFHPGEHYWEFGRTVNGTEVYIKLKIVGKSKEVAFCISFHPSEWPLKYPFRE